MVGIIFIGVLSGMIFGTLAMLMRRFAVCVILLPVLAAPAFYLFAWRDALLGHCFFASNFNSLSCTPFREFLGLSVNYTPEALVVLFAHIVVAFTTFAVLRVARIMIAQADMKSPAEKEAQRIAAEKAAEARAVYNSEVQRLTNEILGRADEPATNRPGQPTAQGS